MWFKYSLTVADLARHWIMLEWVRKSKTGEDARFLLEMAWGEFAFAMKGDQQIEVVNS